MIVLRLILLFCGALAVFMAGYNDALSRYAKFTGGMGDYAMQKDFHKWFLSAVGAGMLLAAVFL